MKRPHILICGEKGAGKSTLIERLLERETRPIFGFITKRLSSDETGFHPIYIHPAGAKERTYSPANLIGSCDAKTHKVNAAVFETLGREHILSACPGGLIVMDELGFMESGVKSFTDTVFAALDGNIPVVAAVKARYDIPFLNEVRAHPKARLFTITPENREELFRELLPLVRAL